MTALVVAHVAQQHRKYMGYVDCLAVEAGDSYGGAILIREYEGEASLHWTRKAVGTCWCLRLYKAIQSWGHWLKKNTLCKGLCSQWLFLGEVAVLLWAERGAQWQHSRIEVYKLVGKRHSGETRGGLFTCSNQLKEKAIVIIWGSIMESRSFLGITLNFQENKRKFKEESMLYNYSTVVDKWKGKKGEGGIHCYCTYIWLGNKHQAFPVSF